MKKQPLVSIITPSFNQAAFLEETILSVLEQTYPAVEYIVVDGGSTDGSLEIIQKYQDDLAAWVSEPDRGQTDAINKGFSRSQGEILAWLNSDDIYYPHTIREVVSFFHANQNVGMVYGDTLLIDEKQEILGKFHARQTSYQRLMRGGVNIPQPAAFWRRGLWEDAGPLNPDYYFAMDYDLWVRFAKRGRIQYIPRTWAGFRVHREAKTFQADDQCWPEMRTIHRQEGGGVFSVFMGKYILRQLLAPLWRKYKEYKYYH